MQVLHADANDDTCDQPVSRIAKETGLLEAALDKWRKQARAEGLVHRGGKTRNVEVQRISFYLS
ncbi:MAG: transposase [Firmicutes bacterium]|nr:transposase [Bacillota bacterium]